MERPLSVKKKYHANNVTPDYPKEAPLVDIEVKGRKGQRKESDEYRLISLINAIARSSAFGRAVLEDAAKDGYTVVMENQRGSCGFCDEQQKVIALNPVLSDDLLVATLAHEARHAQQFSRGAESAFGVFNLKSELMYTRAMEADAETAAAATCHEIRVNTGNEGPWKAFSEDSVEIAAGFMRAAPTQDAALNDKMLQEAFNGWYQDIAMMTSYEESYIVDTMKYGIKRQTRMPAYDKSVESKEIVSLFCSNAEGKCYWENNKDVLNDKEKLSIDPMTYNMAKMFFKVREMRSGQKPDPTLETLPVRFDVNDEGKSSKKEQRAFSIRAPKSNAFAQAISSFSSRNR